MNSGNGVHGQMPLEWLEPSWMLSQLLALMGLLQNLPILGVASEEMNEAKMIVKRLHVAISQIPKEETKPQLTGESLNVTNDTASTH